MTTELVPDTPVTPEDYLLTAEALVRSYCGWHIAPERDETLTLDGPGGLTLVLPSLHVVDITSITQDGEELDPPYDWSASGYVFATGAWSLDISWGCAGWTRTPRGIVVELTHGYAEVPAQVTAAVRSLAGRLTTGSVGLTSLTRGPFSESYGSTGSGGSANDVIGSVEAAALDPYRLPYRP